MSPNTHSTSPNSMVLNWKVGLGFELFLASQSIAETDNGSWKGAFFREEFEIDLEDEKYAKVEVPDLKNGRLGRFIHEFDSYKTAIVDQTGKRCFIMPLRRERPKSMYDMIEKTWRRKHNNRHFDMIPSIQRVRESMRVIIPSTDDLSDLGKYIQEYEDKTTYRLEKSTNRVYKRSVDSTQMELPFTEFAGLFTIDYDIVNWNQIEEAEEH